VRKVIHTGQKNKEVKINQTQTGISRVKGGFWGKSGGGEKENRSIMKGGNFKRVLRGGGGNLRRSQEEDGPKRGGRTNPRVLF